MNNDTNGYTIEVKEEDIFKSILSLVDTDTMEFLKNQGVVNRTWLKKSTIRCNK